MNWVFKSVIAGLVLILFSGSAPELSGQPGTPMFDRLKQSFEEGRVFSASFSHLYSDSFTGEEQRSEGQIRIGKNRYKIEGDRQLVVVDGNISTVYDGARNRVITSDYVEEEDDFAPSRMLQGVDDTFSVTEESAAGGTIITMVSDDPFSVFLEVIIYLDDDGNPVRIEAFDQAENELITSFENGRFIDEQEGMFELEIPDDAEQIDLRQGS